MHLGFAIASKSLGVCSVDFDASIAPTSGKTADRKPASPDDTHQHYLGVQKSPKIKSLCGKETQIMELGVLIGSSKIKCLPEKVRRFDVVTLERGDQAAWAKNNDWSFLGLNFLKLYSAPLFGRPLWKTIVSRCNMQ